LASARSRKGPLTLLAQTGQACGGRARKIGEVKPPSRKLACGQSRSPIWKVEPDSSSVAPLFDPTRGLLWGDPRAFHELPAAALAAGYAGWVIGWLNRPEADLSFLIWPHIRRLAGGK